MTFEPVYEKIKLNSERKKLCKQIRLDCKSEVSAEEVSSVLSVTAWAVITESEIQNGQIRYGGKTIFYISYINADGTLKKCECGNEFKGVVSDQTFGNDARLFVTAKTDKTDYDLSGTKLCAGAYVSVCISVGEYVEGQALCGGDNIIVKENEITSVKSCGVKTGVFPIEEEFETSYPIAEVLCHTAQPVLTAVQSGVGAIIVDGQVLLSVIALQKNEKNDIIRENKTIPFRMEIECEDAMPNMQAIARVKERSHKLDVAVDEDSAKSVLNASVSICLEGEAFFEQPVTVAADAFSTEREVEVTKKELTYCCACEPSYCSAAVQGRATTEELPIGTVILALGNEYVDGLSVRFEGGRALASGVINATAFFRDGEGVAFTRRLETPFESELSCVVDGICCVDVTARAKNARARIVSLNEVEMDVDIDFTVYPESQKSVKIIGEIKDLGEKKKNDAGLSVYIPTEGEELWSLAKRLNVCPKSLVETNSDLQFPLTGKERIVVYRRK